MISVTASLVLLLAVFGVAEATATLSERHPVPYGPRLRSGSTTSTFQWRNAPTGISNDYEGHTGKDGAAKVLQYSLKETSVNGTALQRRMRSSDTAPSEDRDSTLEKRENWNWKYLEDYRGYLYFIESTPLRNPSLPMALPTRGSRQRQAVY